MSVIPVKTGIQSFEWFPAFAGTARLDSCFRRNDKLKGYSVLWSSRGLN